MPVIIRKALPKSTRRKNSKHNKFLRKRMTQMNNRAARDRQIRYMGNNYQLPYEVIEKPKPKRRFKKKHKKFKIPQISKMPKVYDYEKKEEPEQEEETSLFNFVNS